MSRATRDLTGAGMIVLAIVASLILARLLAVAPASNTENQAPAATDLAAVQPPAPSTTNATTPPPPSAKTSTEVPPAPAESVVLSSGVQVVPRPDRTPPTYRSAPTPPPNPPTSPPANPDPSTVDDPEAQARAWLTALCWYDYRDSADENTRRAAIFGDTSMPPGQDPWTLDVRAWAQITAGHLGSGCTNITATLALTQRDGVDQNTVTLTATQILTVDGTAYQSIPITLTRALHPDSEGRWLIGAAVTAN